MKQSQRLILSVAVIFQVFILIGMLAKVAKPFWTGREIRVTVKPVDPRSKFRGNYVQLSYAFSRLSMNAIKGISKLHFGEPVYIRLKEGRDHVYEFGGASLEPIPDGLFIRGRVAQRAYDSCYQVRYGIEAFFAPKEKSLDLEKKLRHGGVAVLMVTPDGKAALKDVISGSASWEQERDETPNPETDSVSGLCEN